MKVVHSTTCIVLLLPRSREYKHGGHKSYVDRQMDQVIRWRPRVKERESAGMGKSERKLNESLLLTYKYALFPRCIIAILSAFAVLYTAVHLENERPRLLKMYYTFPRCRRARRGQYFPRNKSSASGGAHSAMYGARKKLIGVRKVESGTWSDDETNFSRYTKIEHC